MTTLRAAALISTLALTLVACGSDGDSAADTTAAAGTTVTTAPDTTTPSSSGADTTTPGADTTVSVQTGPVQIDVVVGQDSGPDRIEKVAVGSEITLNITNPNADDEFHVHPPIDLEKAAAKGEMVTFNFTVDQAGEIEVESHDTEDVYLVIEVG